MSDPMEPIRRLGRSMEELAGSLGADMQQFLIDADLDDDEGGQDVVRALFVLSRAGDPAEDIDIDAFLEDIEAHVRDNAKE